MLSADQIHRGSHAFARSIGYSPILQLGVKKFGDWCNIWQVSIHEKKCFVLPLGRRSQQENVPQYIVNNVAIPSVRFMKDLGVFMSLDLNFSVHCCKIAAKATQIFGLILRAFASK